MSNEETCRATLSTSLVHDMESRGIDVDLSCTILDRYNRGDFDNQATVSAERLPGLDGDTVVDASGELSVTIPYDEAAAGLAYAGVEQSPEHFGNRDGNSITFDHAALHRIGIHMVPGTAYGVLNGGSATSYADEKKNRGFSEALFGLFESRFERLAEQVRGRAKGLTPAYVTESGAGPSFLELKMRNLLLLARRYMKETGKPLPDGFRPMFQMTSVNNDEEIAAAYRAYRASPVLADLIEETGVDVTDVRTGVQPMISAYTHSEEGRPKRVFDRAWGEPGRSLPLPGGHGQSFHVLADVYRGLLADGFRYAYIGNVDNLGFTVEPATLARFALSGRPAAFEFAFRTPVDIKGGILVQDRAGALTCGDIGPAISRDEVFEAERGGTSILFNCATGLFDLRRLVDDIERITRDLPVRFSDQDKDAGRYSQAEQVTWEVIGMLDNPLILGVDKYRRFLAAKLLSETLMTSGLELENPDYPTDPDRSKDLKHTAEKLSSGLYRALERYYGFRTGEGEPRPLSVGELEAKGGETLGD
ncbi:MAG: UTP--glucose-1-phosphate uridylyltransferase [Spirochaetia bacterium]